jgi:4-hydroxy-3-methylbut-2-enyl diphosphate reductase IspH
MYVGVRVKGQKNIKTKSQQKLDDSCSKINKTSMSHDQRSKEHRWVILKGQKNINTESQKTL